LLWIDAAGCELTGRLVHRDAAARGLALRPGHEATSWRALLADRLDAGDGLSVVGVGERIGPPGVDRAEATNLAARHVHTLRSRLRDAGAIVTAHHAYRLRHRNGSSPYSFQPGNVTALENQSIAHADIGAARSSRCLRQLFTSYPANPWTEGAKKWRRSTACGRCRERRKARRC
jgi:hypothetical protein